MRLGQMVMRGILMSSVLALAGCPPTNTGEDDAGCDFCEPDPTPLEPDKCNTRNDALTVAECQLTLAVAKTEYIGLPGDQDWYLVTLPSNLTARSLIHVSAGYAAPNTAVNLQVNLMREDGTTSLAIGTDKHGQAAPKLIDLIVPFTESSAKLLVLVTDASGLAKPVYDSKSPYTLKVEVMDNPDTNEPNDTTPTPVALAASGAMQTGTATGYLATTGDVDRFSFVAPAGRKITYLHLTSAKLNPPPPYRLAYTLYDSTNKAVAEGRMDNAFLAVDLATARITTGGTYTLKVEGYVGNSTQPIPGDLRLQYTLTVEVMDELDPNSEPNDTLQTATPTSWSAPGASNTFTGRLDHVPDPEWFGFTLAATSGPSVLYYHLTPGTSGARYPPLPGPKDHQIRVFSIATQGATACKTNEAVCPRHPDNNDPDVVGLVDAYCDMVPSRCLTSAREEEVMFSKLRNFEGAVPVPPHATPVTYYILYGDEGNDFADDLDYSLQVEWRAEDANETSSWSGGTEHAVTAGMPADLTGHLSYGYGYFRYNDPNNGDGLRGPRDYDGFASDADEYEISFGGASGDQTWELSWEVSKPSGGPAPFDIILEVTFCGGGGCSVTREIGYVGGDLGGWHSAGQTGVTFHPMFSQSESSSASTVTALPWGCFCFESQYVSAGKFYIKVIGVDRASYADVPYVVHTAMSGYPSSNGAGGGTCPSPCGFTN